MLAFIGVMLGLGIAISLMLGLVGLMLIAANWLAARWLARSGWQSPDTEDAFPALKALFPALDDLYRRQRKRDAEAWEKQAPTLTRIARKLRR